MNYDNDKYWHSDPRMKHMPVNWHYAVTIGSYDAVKWHLYAHIPESGLVEFYAMGTGLWWDANAASAEDMIQVTDSTSQTYTAWETYRLLNDAFGGLNGLVFDWVQSRTSDAAYISNCHLVNGELLHPSTSAVIATLWNGIGYGDDDSTIPCVDNEVIEQDLNGNEVLAFCHRVDIGYDIFVPPTIKEL